MSQNESHTPSPIPPPHPLSPAPPSPSPVKSVCARNKGKSTYRKGTCYPTMPAIDRATLNSRCLTCQEATYQCGICARIDDLKVKDSKRQAKLAAGSGGGGAGPLGRDDAFAADPKLLKSKALGFALGSSKQCQQKGKSGSGGKGKTTKDQVQVKCKAPAGKGKTTQGHVEVKGKAPAGLESSAIAATLAFNHFCEACAELKTSYCPIHKNGPPPDFYKNQGVVHIHESENDAEGEGDSEHDDAAQGDSTAEAGIVRAGQDLFQEREAESTPMAPDTARPAAAAAPTIKPKADKTKWCHQTRVTVFRLIQRINPFVAAHKEKDAAWDKLAKQVHEDTKGHTYNDHKGKVVDARVYSNGQSLQVFFKRRVDAMKAIQQSEGKSGHGGVARDDDSANAMERQAEFAEIQACMRLQEQAGAIAAQKREVKSAQKKLKDDDIPDAVFQAATTSMQFKKSLWNELAKRKRHYEQQEQTLTAAGKTMQYSQKQLHELQEFKRVGDELKQAGALPAVPESDAAIGSDSKRRHSSMLEQFTRVGTALDQLTKQLQAAEKPLDEPKAVLAQRQLDELAADVAEGRLVASPDEVQKLRMRIMTSRYCS